ncbi:MAG: PLP-dependent transferase [Bacteroidales bacterium]|nr:PLP-dependent transferase [Bacteroidales bacterium]
MKNEPVNTRFVPVYRDAGFDLQDAEKAAAAFRSELDPLHHPDDFIYSRYRNPTVVAAEEQLAEVEGSEWALLTESGMAAIDTVLSVFQWAGEDRPWLFFSEIYGGTNAFIDEVLIKRRGLDIRRFVTGGDRHDMTAFKRMLEEVHPDVVYFEAISNPMLIVADGKEIIRLAKEAGSVVIVDNTFATPWLWKPLKDGADVVIHSVTKYLAGHGNLTAGVVCGNDPDFMKDLIQYRKLTGHMLSPDDAARLGDYLRTFSLRIQQHCYNAGKVARELSRRPEVENVLYPGLETHPTHDEAVKLFGKRGFGGMVTFDMAGKNDEEKRLRRDRFIEAVSGHIPLVPTLGDTGTILLPIEPVWGDKYPAPGMIRLSVGIEPAGDLIRILRRGLEM